MQVHFATRIRFPRSFLNPKSIPFQYASLTILKLHPFPNQIANVHLCSMKMERTTDTNPKPPVCPSFSKPGCTCLCTWIQSPGLNHPVSITILQHSLEHKHPLNSTQILRLGLKNVAIATVSDFSFGAKISMNYKAQNKI
ncbi:hypothetical protein NL676_024315 [Syzygium grande]|nr:hypothetical protein NL676_024315 [Syzygium grande]